MEPFAARCACLHASFNTMYVRGYFKLHNLPTALSGSLLLALAFAVGVLHTAVTNGYRRNKIIWTPVGGADGSIADGPWTATALSAAYTINCVLVAIAIFHAGVFPLYRYSNQVRYWHKLQDALAAFGWSFLSLHHVSNAVVMALLIGGIPLAAKLAPALLLLPTAHFMLRLMPWLTPSWHYKLGLQVDLATHLPLAALYAWRAYSLTAPWELMGTAAELLHLSSVIPEAWMHRSKPGMDAVPTASWDDPWGSPSGEAAAAPDQGEHTSEATTNHGAQPAGRGTQRASAQQHEQAAHGSPQPTTSVDTIGARVAARHRTTATSATPGTGAPSTRTAAELHPAGQSELVVSEAVGTEPLAGGSTGMGTPVRHSGVTRKLFSVEEPASEDEAGEQQVKEQGQAGEGTLHPTLTPLARKVKRILAPTRLAAGRKLPVFQMLILINMASFFCYGAMVAFTSAPPLPEVQVVVSGAAHTLEQGTSEVVKRAAQVPSAVKHGLEDAAGAVHGAYKVGQAAHHASQALGSMQHKMQQEAVRLGVQGTQKAAELLTKVKRPAGQHAAAGGQHEAGQHGVE